MEKQRGSQPEATSGRENFNPAYEAFQKHSNDLLKTIENPEVLAWELFTNRAFVISNSTVEFANNMTHKRGERTSKLLMDIQSQIELDVDPGIFDMFLTVLTKQPSISDICKRMKETYGE